MTARPKFKPIGPCQKDPACKRPSGYNAIGYCRHHHLEYRKELRLQAIAAERSRAVREDLKIGGQGS